MKDPSTKFGDLSDPNSLASRLLTKEVISTFETDTDIPATDINKQIEDIRKHGI